MFQSRLTLKVGSASHKINARRATRPTPKILTLQGFPQAPLNNCAHKHKCEVLKNTVA